MNGRSHLLHFLAGQALLHEGPIRNVWDDHLRDGSRKGKKGRRGVHPACTVPPVPRREQTTQQWAAN